MAAGGAGKFAACVARATYRKPLTLLLLVEKDANRILLGLKKRGFGEGRYNGFGGKVEGKETIEEAALREMEEESGVVVTDATQKGLILFEFEGDDQILEVHVFHASKYTGTIVESEEMRPEWFSLDEVPFAKMWPDDSHWFPTFLDDKKFTGYFLFRGHDDIIDKELVEVDDLPSIPPAVRKPKKEE